MLTNNFLLPIYRTFTSAPSSETGPGSEKGPAMPVKDRYYVKNPKKLTCLQYLMRCCHVPKLAQYDVVGKEVVEDEGGAMKFKSDITLAAIEGTHVVGLCKNVNKNDTMHVFGEEDIDVLKEKDLLEIFLRSKSSLKEDDLYRVTEVTERADSVALCVEKLWGEDSMRRYIQSMSNYLVVTKGAIFGAMGGAGAGLGTILGVKAIAAVGVETMIAEGHVTIGVVLGTSLAGIPVLVGVGAGVSLAEDLAERSLGHGITNSKFLFGAAGAGAVASGVVAVASGVVAVASGGVTAGVVAAVFGGGLAVGVAGERTSIAGMAVLAGALAGVGAGVGTAGVVVGAAAGGSHLRAVYNGSITYGILGLLDKVRKDLRSSINGDVTRYLNEIKKVKQD